MPTPAIAPTITQRVRVFLAEQGAKLPPWSGLQETYDQLYGLLHQRRADPEFWRPLKHLLREVVASAATAQARGRGASAQAELLASWKVDELVDDLRKALPDDAGSARTDFTRSLSAAVLGGFLLLGLAAAGCGSDSEQNLPAGTGGALGTGGHMTSVTGSGGRMGSGGTSGTGGATTIPLPGTGGSGAGGSVVLGTGGALGAGGAGGSTASDPLDGGSDAPLDGADAADQDGAAWDVAKSDTVGLEAAAPACTQTMAIELDRAIGQSSLTAAQKSQLCACFSALGTGWTTSLTELFATATPDEISKMLSGLTSCCRTDGIHNTSGVITTPNADDLRAVKNGMSYYFCAVPVYKGVSFPEDESSDRYRR